MHSTHNLNAFPRLNLLFYQAHEARVHEAAREFQRRELDLQRLAKEEARIAAQHHCDQVAALRDEAERAVDAARAQASGAPRTSGSGVCVMPPVWRVASTKCRFVFLLHRACTRLAVLLLLRSPPSPDFFSV